MEPSVASLLGTLVQELSVAVYTAETSEQATALLSSQLELLRLQQVKQEPTEMTLPAAKVPRLGAAGVELLDAEASPASGLVEPVCDVSAYPHNLPQHASLPLPLAISRVSHSPLTIAAHHSPHHTPYALALS